MQKEIWQLRWDLVIVIAILNFCRQWSFSYLGNFAKLYENYCNKIAEHDSSPVVKNWTLLFRSFAFPTTEWLFGLSEMANMENSVSDIVRRRESLR